MPISRISRRFGIAVRNRRTAIGLSQEKLAEHTGLHPTYVSMVERAVRNPTLEVSAGIARAVEIALPRLIEEAQQHVRNSPGKNQRMSSRWEVAHHQKRARLGDTT